MRKFSYVRRGLDPAAGSQGRTGAIASYEVVVRDASGERVVYAGPDWKEMWQRLRAAGLTAVQAQTLLEKSTLEVPRVPKPARG